MKRIISIILFCFATMQLISQDRTDFYDYNYIRTFIPIRNNADTAVPLHGQIDYENEWSEQVSYFDGLGRPMQDLQVAASPIGWDIIQPYIYDNSGRLTREYLPYTYPQVSGNTPGAFRDRAIIEQKYFYQATIQENPNYTFAEKSFDGSPLNKVLKQGFAGEPWNMTDGRVMESAYSTNSENYEVFFLSVTDNGVLSKEGFYPATKLHKTITKDENHNYTTVYADFSNRTLLQVSSGSGISFSTYYVYDDLGNLRYVLPPLTTVQIQNASISETFNLETSWVQQLCYYYEYDKKGRMIKKKLPGKDIEFMIYDERNRLVLTQDGNLRAANNWLFTKYDAFNRPIITSSYQNNAAIGQPAMQDLVDNVTTFFETFSSGDFFGYTNIAFPDIESLNCKVNTVSFYDNYKYYEAQSESFKKLYSFNEAEIDFIFLKDNKTKGQITTTMVRTLPTDQIVDANTDEWQFTLYYYDKYGNAIQSIKTIAFRGVEIVSNKFNFTRQLLASRDHLVFASDRTSESISTLQKFTYDRAGRMLNTTHQVNEDTLVNLCGQVYDELGRLKTKKLHKPESGLAWAQQIGYRYNVRNWLTGINNDLFSLTLGYNETQGTPQYNGNISEMFCQSPSYDMYLFTYDGLNRLTKATHPVGGAYGTSYSYDKNGNILKLFRAGIDSLSYAYKGNQLASVNDVLDDQCQNNGFTDDGFFELTEYAYDNNGNMLVDLNKQISLVTYNYLNLPNQINIVRKGDFDNILYQYDATGQKLIKQTKVNGRVITTTHYIGNFVFENGALKHIITSEGLVEPMGGKMVYQYFIKDHLGNNRVLFNGDNLVLQQNSYYPFGMLVTPLRENRAYYDYNRYLYNGKELQDDFELDWYDYGARFYDPTLVRFHSIDNYSEKYHSQSTYQYALNNPISNIDIMGDSAWTINNTWNNDFISKYQSSVQNRIQQYQKDGKEFTCEDLALSIMMDFAEENRLPVSITNESGTYDARSNDYTDAESFKNDVLTTTAAPDLQNKKNTSTIDAGQATSGDIILNRNSEGKANHTQVVNSPVNSIGVMGIKQGNAGAMNIVPGASRVFGAGNPKSAFYTGKPIESAIYVPAANFYKNYSTGDIISNYSTQKNIVFKRFNFNKF